MTRAIGCPDAVALTRTGHERTGYPAHRPPASGYKYREARCARALGRHSAEKAGLGSGSGARSAASRPSDVRRFRLRGVGNTRFASWRFLGSSPSARKMRTFERLCGAHWPLEIATRPDQESPLRRITSRSEMP